MSNIKTVITNCIIPYRFYIILTLYFYFNIYMLYGCYIVKTKILLNKKSS